MTPLSAAPRRIAWSNPKAGRRLTEQAGWSLIALEPFATGELILTWGGVIVTTAQLQHIPEFARHRSIQVEENLHLCSGLIDDVADCVNHSCSPNAGLRGQISLVALRDIAPEEEICFDYGTSDGDPNFYMPCFCGSANCRGKVTGEDWRLPELQAAYKGHFMPYLQRRMEMLP
ncbi:MAG TPA: SET domain-containing protein-lysine N-methyltransferase [Aggregatilineales bacterium]|nr:SET domain-containing protein-lysine N-methyltransferase [Anaerolineales bacterium]HRE47808.1 SET domain-containing protein-lysine N-methyltransferase [Aggregatilineales bacterium]